MQALKRIHQIFVTTKLWDDSHGSEEAVAALETSLKKLGLDYVDLYLIHSPTPGKKLRLESWKALEKLKNEGKIKSIGVSNYGVHHLKELLEVCTVKPVVNQIEASHLFLQQQQAFSTNLSIGPEGHTLPSSYRD